MLKITFNDKLLKKLSKRVSDFDVSINAALKDRAFRSQVGLLLTGRAKTNLESGGTGDSSYTLLRPSTIKQKARKGYSAKPLQRTGLLKQSILYNLPSEGVIMTALDIAKHHHFGAPKANIPQREIFTIDDDDLDDTHDFLINRFLQLNPDIKK